MSNLDCKVASASVRSFLLSTFSSSADIDACNLGRPLVDPLGKPLANIDTERSNTLDGDLIPSTFLSLVTAVPPRP